MDVAVIGTGKMGSGIARLLASKGVQVALGARDPAEAAKLAEEIGAGSQGGGVAAAVKLADVIILAVWYQQMAEVIREAGDLTGKILVDISNPITEDFKGLRIGHTTSAAPPDSSGPRSPVYSRTSRMSNGRKYMVRCKQSAPITDVLY